MYVLMCVCVIASKVHGRAHLQEHAAHKDLILVDERASAAIARVRLCSSAVKGQPAVSICMKCAQQRTNAKTIRWLVGCAHGDRRIKGMQI
eukprot:3721237-Pleurochrysis_carterae.AAC.1